MLTRDEFRTVCEAELNKPYIWGGEGPDGYDCSGLAQCMLERLNLDPPGDQTAEGLFRHFSAPGRAMSVSVAESALGDIVFFGGDTVITHVALAWGDQAMFEAGGGNRTTTTPERARQQGAQVRIVPISRRHDLVSILRPAALEWDSPTYSLETLAQGFGRYEGDPVTRWLDDGRHMQLVSPFSYVRENQETWPVPANAIVDGASIPQIFWTFIGGPFEGRYRDASVVHDYYCDQRSRPWRDTHRVFYEAMMCSNVPSAKAKLMYYAVYRFGPRWETAVLTGLETLSPVAGRPASAIALPLEPFDAESFENDVERILRDDPDLETIEAMADNRNN